MDDGSVAYQLYADKRFHGPMDREQIKAMLAAQDITVRAGVRLHGQKCPFEQIGEYFGWEVDEPEPEDEEEALEEEEADSEIEKHPPNPTVRYGRRFPVKLPYENDPGKPPDADVPPEKTRPVSRQSGENVEHYHLGRLAYLISCFLPAFLLALVLRSYLTPFFHKNFGAKVLYQSECAGVALLAGVLLAFFRPESRPALWTLLFTALGTLFETWYTGKRPAHPDVYLAYTLIFSVVTATSVGLTTRFFGMVVQRK